MFSALVFNLNPARDDPRLPASKSTSRTNEEIFFMWCRYNFCWINLQNVQIFELSFPESFMMF